MLKLITSLVAVLIAAALSIPSPRTGKALPPVPTQTPRATATEGASVEQPAGVERLEDQAVPAGCDVPPPWSDWDTALACHSYYPAPRAEPLPGCRLDYTVQGNLLAWGYIAFPGFERCH
jgi:hypothetical protein